MSTARERLDARIERGWRLGLEGMRATLANLPPVEYPVILVGGTNGKGSVCAALDAYFRNCGLRVGLTTSPHLLDVRERIAVDGRIISEEDFATVFEEIEAIDEDRATYFEMLSLMAIRHFQKQKVDVAVVEIGLGGRLDAFNALDPAVSVITSIGLEHTQWLGDTLEAIAFEKAQIARRGRAAVLGCSLPALRAEVEKIGARIVEVGRRPGSTCFEHNREIAVAAAREFCAERGLAFDESSCRDALASAKWPGRYDVFPGSPTVILDAAHNPPAAEELASCLRCAQHPRPLVAVVTLLGDKDDRGFFAPLAPVVDRWIVTEVPVERGRAAAAIAAPEGSIIVRDPSEAVEQARSEAGPGGTVLVTGSIYLLGEVLRKMGLRSHR